MARARSGLTGDSAKQYPSGPVRASARWAARGVGYVRAPLGKTEKGDRRTFWTLVFDSETFAGPLGYYLPEFFGDRDKSARADGAYPDPSWYSSSFELEDMGTPGMAINNSQFAMEWNHGFTYQQRTRAGRLFYKLPNLSFPFRESELLLATGHQTHTDAEVAAPIEAALAREHRYAGDGRVGRQLCVASDRKRRLPSLPALL